MLVLIGRELRAIGVYLALPIMFAVIMIWVTVAKVAWEAQQGAFVGIPGTMLYTLWPELYAFPFMWAGIGAAQMYGDRAKKISTFLSTLATSRGQILGARVIAGLGGLLVILGAVALVDVILLGRYPCIVPVDYWVLVSWFVTIGLVNFACYMIGLMVGWSGNKMLPILGGIFLAAPLVAVPIIKGFEWEGNVILLIAGMAALMRIWQRYSRAPV